MDYRFLEQEQENVQGVISSVIYRNEESGYSVLKLDASEGRETVTVVGCVPFAWPGQSLCAYGEWENNNAHGLQFKVSSAEIFQPTELSDLYQYLAGGVIKGIGPATASVLIDRFGRETLRVISEQPERLTEVRGISAAKADSIHAEYRKQLVINILSEYITLHRLRPVLALRMYRYYGLSAAEILEANPYVIASAHIGGHFSEADNLAIEMGMEGHSDNRIKAAIVFELNYNLNNGHCFCPREKLRDAVCNLIGVEPEDVSRCMEDLIDEGQIILDSVRGCAEACYLPALYDAEVSTAERLAQMALAGAECGCNVGELIGTLEAREDIRYTAQQKKTLSLAAENRILAITGGPGTGKTTSIKAVFALFQRMHIDTVLAAPTGRAAKRISEVTGEDAYTVHRLLGAKMSEDGETVTFDRDAENPLDCSAVILDECSMVDIQLMSALLNALPEDARLVLVGDADQLPSVGPGNVFSAILRSGVIPCVVLKEIFRQGKGSSIVRNAYMINVGEHPDFSDNSGDFFRLNRLDAGKAASTITELFADRLPNKMGISPNDIQVLSPSRKGELGTVRLNACLQNELNPRSPEKKEKIFGDRVYREGDRVMQIKNNYDIIWETDSGNRGLGIFNGDTGVIRSVDDSNGWLLIEFDGKTVRYSYDFLTELEHAWAVTVHKAQGSEYRAVILALSEQSSLLLTRGVLYTAVSRARQLLIMVGDERVAHRMIDNSKQANRYTALRSRLMSLCEKA